jgi:hypothetical protein
MMYSDDWKQRELDTLQKPIAEIALDASVNARITLMAGFTSVRDVGSHDYLDVGLRNAIRNGKVPGPRMLVSVHAIGATGGHCDDSDGFRAGLFWKETGPIDGVINGADQARYAVRLMHKYGADVIKTCASGGVLSPTDDVDTPQLTQEELNALVDEAHALRRKVATHCHGAEAAKRAIRAGVNSVISVMRAFTLASRAISAIGFCKVSSSRCFQSSEYIMVKWVCASMNPGSSVASPRSITWAPAGIAALAPAATILLSVTTTTPGATKVLALPSNRRAAFKTMVLPLGCCWDWLLPENMIIMLKTSSRTRHLRAMRFFSPCTTR